MFVRRLSNLRLTGGTIHPNLPVQIERKSGHLERAKYYCYKCENEAIEVSSENFRCDPCGVNYNTEKFRFRREHRHLNPNES
jgi:hypothetical protein